MDSVDINKLWYSDKLKSYITLNTPDIKILTDTIISNHGGILKKETHIGLSHIVRCKYDIVVIDNSPYLLLKELGRGYYGRVYKGYDLKRNIYIAIKCQSIDHSDVIVKQVVATRNNGIGLADPRVRVSGPSFLSDKNGYFVLPLADICYDKWIFMKIKENNIKAILSSLIKIAEDIGRLHYKGKVHMDLKIDNILVIDNIPYISDFGKVENIGTTISSSLENFRKYPQCAPEMFMQVSKSYIYTVSSLYDLYSLGYLMSIIAKYTIDKNFSKELSNISSNIHVMDPVRRTHIHKIIVYLRSLLNAYKRR